MPSNQGENKVSFWSKERAVILLDFISAIHYETSSVSILVAVFWTAVNS
jgi:hypothetical protein